MRSGPSPPRSESTASLCRLVPSLDEHAGDQRRQHCRPMNLPAAAHAKAAPTATGVIDRLSVRGRAAIGQEEGIMR